MRLVCLLMTLAATAAAFQPDYFPLRVGNQWVYRHQGVGAGAPVVVEVTDVQVFSHLPFALVEGFPSGDVWLRLEEDGRLLARDPQTGAISTWVPFAATAGESFVTTIDPCNNAGSIVSREARVTGPIGEFSNTLEVAYTASCADAGILTDHYLPYIGLIRRTVTTIAGPRSWELVYARLGGVTFVSEPALSVGLSLNQSVFPASEEAAVLRARLTLRNHRLEPVTLTFPSSQRFDFVIKDSSGTVLYNWSAGRAFLQVITTETFRNEKNYVVETPLATDRGPFPSGAYTIEATLTTMEPTRFGAVASFIVGP